MPGEDHVARVEGRAVVPRHAASQMVGNGAAVFGDAAVLQGGQLRRQFGHVLILVAPVEKEPAPEHGQVGVDLLVTDFGIERIGLL